MNFIIAALALSGCGFSQRDTVIIGQIKGIHRQTPLICGDYIYTDISLGVMRNGVGSMSTQDVEIRVTEDQATKITAAQADGELIEISYDLKRWVWCGPNKIATSVQNKLVR